MLVAYLRGHPKVKLDIWEEWEEEGDRGEDNNNNNNKEEDNKNSYRETNSKEKESNLAEATDDDNFKYTIYDLNFSSRKSLTSYYKKHLKAKFFNKPFQYPEYRRQ